MFRLIRVAPWLGTLIVLAGVFAIAARSYARHYALTSVSIAGIYGSFLLMLALALTRGFLGRDLIAWHRGCKLLLLLCCLPYLIYAWSTGDFHWLALLKLVALPALLLAIYRLIPVKNVSAFCWQDFLAGCLLIAVVLSGVLRGIWNVPVNLDFMNRLYLIAVAAWTWTALRPVPELGYQFSFSTAILKQAALNFAWFAGIGIPLSLAMHFTRWNPHWHGIGLFSLNFLEIFLFIALLEELFFRGFLQTLLTKTWRDWRWAQLFGSCLFGLFHILHAPFPNWRYVLLASIAGWFYGSAFRKTGNLTTSALVHAAVDTTWRTWFSAR